MRGSSPRQSEGRPTRWYDEPCPAAPLRIAAWQVLDSNLSAGLSDQGSMPPNCLLTRYFTAQHCSLLLTSSQRVTES